MPVEVPSTLIQTFLATIDAGVVGHFMAASGRMAGAVAGPFASMLLIFIILWGIGVMVGWVAAPLADAVKNIIVIALIMSLALNVAVYGSQIAMRVYEFPNQLAAVVTGGDTVSVNTLLDDSLTKGNRAAVTIKNTATWSEPIDGLGLYLTALVIWIFTGVVVAIAAAFILVTKLFLGICISVGPLFIIMALFKATRAFFEGWVRQTLTYVFFFAILAAAISLLFTLWNVQIDFAVEHASNGFASFIPALVIGLAGIVTLLYATFLARGLVGGWHADTLGVFARAGAMGSRAFRGVGRAIRGAP